MPGPTLLLCPSAIVPLLYLAISSTLLQHATSLPSWRLLMVYFSTEETEKTMSLITSSLIPLPIALLPSPISLISAYQE
jgi:hypothetical protein